MIAPHSEAAAPTALANPGETLRAERESKDWSLSSVAKQLNLSERSLSQIEAGDFSQLPGHTFARGYVRAYAKLLGLDQNRLVQQFDQHTGTDATGSSVNSLGHIDEPVRLSRSMVRFFTLILTLAIAVGAFLWWQDRTTRNEANRSVSPLERIEVEAADGTTEIHLLDRADEPAELAADEPVDSTPPTTDDDAQDFIGDALPSDGQLASESPIDASAEQDEAVPSSEVPTAAPEADTRTAPMADAETVAPGEGRVALDYTADCWTRVTDSDGKVLYSGLGKAGTSRTLVGKAPLDVHLGFASGVQVSFNGEAVSLSGKTRGETARFKLGQ
ncbi:Cro/Cl family transcriptional regulator [Stutzerimonas stutzeri]|uniref:Cro/Cl family transcriptional regulator n=1 Tax=Stutzerimonas stutzeri TaxID=316 RepID=W8RD63_STUST|nr:RodZ family helix-turn-helix domain-containing protein [Stutzerimonas stutzeri]AHL76402.1 Cro/Cl family transcriptional regulator [Stutzerimonas stutzeri]MCQ4329634.1 helix-turn-helix domain-containing protein [Stutzerimonas stutzeri]